MPKMRFIRTVLLPGSRVMELWEMKKTLDTMKTFECPNPDCSAVLNEVELSGRFRDAQKTCSECHTRICGSCRVVWHQRLTCAEFRMLPTVQRSPRTKQTLQLSDYARRRTHVDGLTVLHTGAAFPPYPIAQNGFVDTTPGNAGIVDPRDVAFWGAENSLPTYQDVLARSPNGFDDTFIVGGGGSGWQQPAPPPYSRGESSSHAVIAPHQRALNMAPSMAPLAACRFCRGQFATASDRDLHERSFCRVSRSWHNRLGGINPFRNFWN
ncbi:uncharacterized protein BXZ73DRAFT_98368 [Epithele typhae]|uniref:uncharacterized protein n=1 Tax=Epithele typhae TaxID=378194 RepID=UPI0020086CA0|nr:uncharacterized protein BXZ73DRAFT_98368 [Epithele typhae]KAH9941155.1 hypothetical protein BXZ73DRAFT_98368 [Epithele typhae]